MNFKKFLTKKNIIIASIIIFIGIVFTLGIYYKSTHYKSNINVTYNNVDSTKITQGKIKIGVFSDVHLFYDYQLENLESAVKLLNDQDCDMIVFNGDLLNFASIPKENFNRDKIVEILKLLKPKYGKFAVLGDQDLLYKDITNILNDSNFEVIDNITRDVYINKNTITIAGIGIETKPEDIIKNISEKKFNIIFTHNPQNIDIISKYAIDMVVSSHTLGGQFLLPLYGSIYPEFREFAYYHGYKLVDKTHVFITNGLGTFERAVRFNAPSSVDVFIIE